MFNEMSRRGFLKGLGAGAVAVSAMGTGLTSIIAVAEGGQQPAAAAAEITPELLTGSLRAYPQPKGEETWPGLGVFQYDMTYYVALVAEEGARIYYEVAYGADEAPNPSAHSKQFDPYQYQWIMLSQPTTDASSDEEKQQLRSKVYNIKARAYKDGVWGEVANWNYEVTSNPRNTIKICSAFDCEGKDIENVTLLQDYDSDNILLINGRDKAIVYDFGYFDPACPADLYGEVRKIVGEDKPIDAIVGHTHGDHVQMAYQFLEHDGVRLLCNKRGTESFIPALVSKGVASGRYADEAAVMAAIEASGGIYDVESGDIFDLGDMKWRAIALPGHQIAGIMLFNEETGVLLSSDQLGNNRAHRADSCWMQWTAPDTALDVYLSNVEIANEKLLGKERVIWNGHNDAPLDAPVYIDNVIKAARSIVDNGIDELTPTLNAFDAYSTRTAMSGDRLTDLNWAGLNVGLSNALTPEYLHGNHGRIAELSNLSVRVPGKAGNLLWDDPAFGINLNWYYPDDGTGPFRKAPEALSFKAKVDASVTAVDVVPTACATLAGITVNGAPAASGEAFNVALTGATTVIGVVSTSPDGSAKFAYTVTIEK